MYDEEYDAKFAARVKQETVALGPYQLLTIVALIRMRRRTGVTEGDDFLGTFLAAKDFDIDDDDPQEVLNQCEELGCTSFEDIIAVLQDIVKDIDTYLKSSAPPFWETAPPEEKAWVERFLKDAADGRELKRIEELSEGDEPI